MLRITTLTAEDRVTLKLEGKLSGPWVGEMAKVWERVRPGIGRRPIKVDLQSVSFVDERGKGVLTAMRQGGAELVAAGPLMTALLEEIAQSCQPAAGSRPPQQDTACLAAPPTRRML